MQQELFYIIYFTKAGHVYVLQVVETLASVEVEEVDVEIQPRPVEDLVVHPWDGEMVVMGTMVVPH